MSQQKKWTLEEVEKHIEEYEQKEQAQGVNNSDVCEAFNKYGPVLLFLSNFPFFGKNLRKGMLIIHQALETNCES